MCINIEIKKEEKEREKGDKGMVLVIGLRQ